MRTLIHARLDLHIKYCDQIFSSAFLMYLLFYNLIWSDQPLFTLSISVAVHFL